jgi:hypothetical protein
MKKILVLLTIFSMVFTSCEPLEMINAESDAMPNPIVGDVIFTMSDDDYDVVDRSYGNFDSEAQAKEKIPTLLNSKYPVWGNKSSATVTFKLYNKVNTYSKNIYALSDAEHNAITGQTYGNFDKSYHVTNYLEATYPDASEGDFHSLKYRFYAGGESTLTDGFVFENSEWTKITGFTPDNYSDMGESYPNFSSHDEAEIKIPVALLDVYKFAGKEAGDIVTAMYELYKGGGVTKSYTANYIFDGISWSKYTNTINETIQFGHDGSVWVPDNTIKYTLVRNADYEYMSAQLTGNSDFDNVSLGNLASYGDFDYNWSDEQIYYALALFLDYLDPSAAEGQKYILTYVIYDNGENDYQTSFIKTDGAWVVND